MVSLFLYIGLLALIAGVFLLFAPSILRKANEISSKIITKVDTLTFAYRVGVGVSFFIASAFMFFMAYYFSMKYR
ncbi:MAG: hypothetical protein HY754_10205 [Nitrospirae bacterium]|nr:hypothetical protein [Nitrospirota bacterium]